MNDATTVKLRRKAPVKTTAPLMEVEQPPPEVHEPAVTDDPVVSYRWGWYLLSIFMPFAGILIGIFFYDRSSAQARRVGRTSLIMGFVLWVLLPLALGLLLAVLGMVSALGFVSNLMPPSP